MARSAGSGPGRRDARRAPQPPSERSAGEPAANARGAAARGCSELRGRHVAWAPGAQRTPARARAGGAVPLSGTPHASVVMAAERAPAVRTVPASRRQTPSAAVRERCTLASHAAGCAAEGAAAAGPARTSAAAGLAEPTSRGALNRPAGSHAHPLCAGGAPHRRAGRVQARTGRARRGSTARSRRSAQKAHASARRAAQQPAPLALARPPGPAQRRALRPPRPLPPPLRPRGARCASPIRCPRVCALLRARSCA